MDHGPVIRLFTFRPARPAFDEILRNELIPELRSKAGLLDCYSGRQGPDELGQRIVASIWRDRATMAEAVSETLGVFRPERLEETTDRVLEVMPLRIAETFALDGEPRILRVLRGRVRPGEMDHYEQDVRHGMALDIAGATGPAALYLAEDPPDGFLTMSVWRDWLDIERATGGDVHRPRATRQPERLVAFEVDHYEMVGTT
jgi:hypothetical protein